MPTILIIDDESSLVSSLTFALRNEGYEVEGALTAAEGRAAAERLQPSLVLLDVRLPDSSGLEVLEGLRATQPSLPVIMISAHGDARIAVRAVKAGAVDYLTKPFELDELLLSIRSALERERMSNELARYREHIAGAEGQLIGDSPPMRSLREAVRQVGSSKAGKVLLLGESGTGKTLVAKAIHACGPRADGPFVEVNCAALPEHLIEAELFGAEKGAYTGAHQKRVGLVTLADGGTLFLDEIGELPMALQAKLLQFLENGTYRPVGAGRPRASDARVVAATNRSLSDAVKAGTFREDLYYRLAVVQIPVPALRDRGADVLRLVEHYIGRIAKEEGAPPLRLTAEAAALLSSYAWPGNIRELRNLVERLTILNPGQVVTAAHLPAELRRQAPWPPPPEPEPREGAAAAAGAAPQEPGRSSIGDELASAERRLLEEALRESGGARAQAAARLGISRHALKRRLRRLGLN